MEELVAFVVPRMILYLPHKESLLALSAISSWRGEQRGTPYSALRSLEVYPSSDRSYFLLKHFIPGSLPSKMGGKTQLLKASLLWQHPKLEEFKPKLHPPFYRDSQKMEVARSAHLKLKFFVYIFLGTKIFFYVVSLNTNGSSRIFLLTHSKIFSQGI